MAKAWIPGPSPGMTAENKAGNVQYDLLLENCNAATMAGAAPYGAIEDAAIGISGEKIAWVGPRKEAGPAKARVDLKQRWVMPGLIDCHTHIVYGGDRANEFELRLKGATYEEIAKAGGGIVSTVKATRAASEDDLVASARKRVAPLLNEGVTVIEIKSGYGLDLETERRMLKAARTLGKTHHLPCSACLAAGIQGPIRRLYRSGLR